MSYQGRLVWASVWANGRLLSGEVGGVMSDTGPDIVPTNCCSSFAAKQRFGPNDKSYDYRQTTKY